MNIHENPAREARREKNGFLGNTNMNNLENPARAARRELFLGSLDNKNTKSRKSGARSAPRKKLGFFGQEK
jgi:hypothetical protein